ncbi:MAG: hypothetical protein AAGF24_06520 [Cyanobacteria bacterium P01_H01_bin.121]
MQISELTPILTERFGEAVAAMPPDAWQVDTPDVRLLLILSADQTWLRVLCPICPVAEVQAFLEQFLAANFDRTQLVRYAIHEAVLWAVFHHDLASLTLQDLQLAIDQLLALKQQGIDESFDAFVDRQIAQIIQAAKQQGQTLEATLQTLDRFYQEGLMGGLQQTPEQRQDTLQAWQRRLQSLWDQVEG